MCVPQAAGKAAGVSCAASGYNPMQSLSHSAFFSAADDDGSDGGSLREGDCNSELIGAEASTESSYAMLVSLCLCLVDRFSLQLSSELCLGGT